MIHAKETHVQALIQALRQQEVNSQFETKQGIFMLFTAIGQVYSCALYTEADRTSKELGIRSRGGFFETDDDYCQALLDGAFNKVLKVCHHTFIRSCLRGLHGGACMERLACKRLHMFTVCKLSRTWWQETLDNCPPACESLRTFTMPANPTADTEKSEKLAHVDANHVAW